MVRRAGRRNARRRKRSKPAPQIAHRPFGCVSLGRRLHRHRGRQSRQKKYRRSANRRRRRFVRKTRRLQPALGKSVARQSKKSNRYARRIARRQYRSKRHARMPRALYSGIRRRSEANSRRSDEIVGYCRSVRYVCGNAKNRRRLCGMHRRRRGKRRRTREKDRIMRIGQNASPRPFGKNCRKRSFGAQTASLEGT